MNMASSWLNIVAFSFLIYCVGCSKRIDPRPYLFQPYSPPPPQAEIRQHRERINAYLAAHPEITPDQRGLLEAGVLGEGVTKEQARLILWHTPDKIEHAPLKYEADEMWFYHLTHANYYLYFKDELLIKIDHRR